MRHSASLAVFAFALSTFAQSTIKGTIEKLQSFQIENMNTDVPPALGELHEQLKRQLRDFIVGAFHKDADVEAALIKGGIHIGANDEKSPYGQIYKTKIDWKPNGLSNWVAVTTTLGVMCGEDTSLYLLERDGMGWRLRFALESRLQKDVSTAHGGFHYGVSKVHTNGRLFVVGVNVTPWCSSTWMGLRVEAFVLGSRDAAASRVLKREGSIHIGDDDYRLSVQDRQFTLEYTGDGRLTESDRRHVLTYYVAERSATRAAPIALTPADFVDEWASVSWEEAKRWSPDNLGAWHGALKNGSIRFVQPCPTKQPQWQIGLFREDDADELYLTVMRKNGDFYLQNIETKRGPGCPGEAPAL